MDRNVSPLLNRDVCCNFQSQALLICRDGASPIPTLHLRTDFSNEGGRVCEISGQAKSSRSFGPAPRIVHSVYNYS